MSGRYLSINFPRKSDGVSDCGEAAAAPHRGLSWQIVTLGVIADLNDNSATRFFSLFIERISGFGQELCADLCSTSRRIKPYSEAFLSQRLCFTEFPDEEGALFLDAPDKGFHLIWILCEALGCRCS